MYLVEDLLRRHGKRLKLSVSVGKPGIKRPIKIPEVQRPGLSLSGYLKSHSFKGILIFGRVEIEYLKDLTQKLRVERLSSLLTSELPAVIVSRGFYPPQEMVDLCEKRKIPLLRSGMTALTLMSKLTLVLSDEFSPCATCHGTFVEVFGVGVLIQGESSVGKSETALGLIERGHRLISDDVVNVKKREDNSLEGFGAELTKHHMEIRGIGIINVASLYGIVCVKEQKTIEVVVKLEAWNNSHFYNRAGMDDSECDILGVKLPFHIVPVKPGRDVVLLIETLALNHRLKIMGYNSAKEFHIKLTKTIERNAQKGKSPIKGRLKAWLC